MSTDEGNNAEQAAPTPILNNLLSKPGPGTESQPALSQEPAQNGTGEAAAPGSASTGHPGQPPPQQPGYPPHYPPHFMPGRPPGPFPGYPPGPGFPPPGPHGYPAYPPHMMRPPQGDLVRMPPGPNPLEWASQQKKLAESHGPGTPASVPAPSPAASSIAEEGAEDKARQLDSPSWPQKGPHGGPPGPPPAGMIMHPHPGMLPPGAGMVPQPPPGPRRETIVDKLVGQITSSNPPRVMPERRAFFDRLCAICEQNGDPITMIPQVSKQTVDLHRLYIAVRNKGGFEQVTKEKLWKSMCQETNPDISESSAAGYQLRKHYQRHLLNLECMETGKNVDDAVAFADKQKRQRRKDGQATPGTPGQPPVPSTSGYPPPGADPSQYPPPPQPGQPPYGYPGYPPGVPPGYPPSGYPQRMPPGVTPMRAPQPQPHMPGAVPDEGAQNALQVPNPAIQPATPGSQAGPASVQPGTPQAASQQEATSQAGSRAPSVGPNVGAATPDSSSRMSASNEGEARPESAANAAATLRPVAGTPTPGGTPVAPPGQMTPGHPMHMPPSTSMASVPPGQGPPGHPGAYYGQPAPMYPNGPARPDFSGPPGYPPHGYPQGYPPHPGAPPGMPGVPPQHFPPGGHPAAHPSHPSHPHHQQYMAQYWQQRGYPPPPQQRPGQPGQMPPQPYGYPPRIQPPQQQPIPPSAPSPSSSKMRYPAGAHPQQPTTPQFPSQATPQRPMQQPMPQYQQQPTHPQQQGPPAPQQIPMVLQYPGGQTFPPQTIEATTISQSRRKRTMARDLYLATPRRLVMALRSGLETEAIWSLNALNVLLYDDSNTHPTLNQMPGLLNVLIEHFWATLSLLFPEHFPISGTSSRQIVYPTDSKVLEELINDANRMEIKPIVTTKEKDKKANYTKFSRAGRKVQVEKADLPETLKRQLMGEQGTSNDDTLNPEYLDEKLHFGLGGGLAERVAERLRIGLEFQQAEKEPIFSKHQGKSIWGEEDFEEEKEEVKEEPMHEEDILIHRKPRPEELLDGQTDFEMKWPKATALTDRDEFYHRMAMRALSISNILRGFSFLPGNENQLSRHHGLLYIIGRFMTLYCNEQPLLRNPPKKLEIDAPIAEPEPFHVVRRKALAILNPHDNKELMMIDTANQLRDDIFVMLCHLSPYMDLYDVPGDLSFPIYNGLLHWATSSVPEAVDPIPPAATSLRNYCFETMCKMSVFERNIDMILSTGSWPRLEKLARLLTKLTTLGEETQNREFAIVILSAFCLASEPMSYIVAVETELINHLISFIEHHDQAMHQVMQTHGMATLRDNPELMGTSIGMLRRAATLLRHFAKIPETRKIFLKNTARLLQFTMSQLMDSRVAAYVAELLYEIQGTLFEEPEPRPPKEETEQEEKTKEEIEQKEPVIKAEVELAEEKNGHLSPAISDSSSCENTMNSEKGKKCNGKANSKKSTKRKNSAETSPPPKRNCMENGFPEKKNGKLEKPIQLKESRTENSSSMAVVA